MSNASQQQNSLLTGKLTGKISEMALTRRSDRHFMQAITVVSGEIPCEN